MENINKKEIMASYLQLCGKEDMVDAVLKYCDDESGIIFNKHPAKNEDKFAEIFDYSAITQTKASNLMSTLNLLGSSQGISHSVDGKSDKDNQPTIRSVAYFSRKCSKETSENGKEAGSYKSFYSLHKLDEEPARVNKIVTKEELEMVEELLKNRESLNGIDCVNEKDAISDMLDSVCDVIVPDGKGKLMSVAEEHGYILLENGTHNCYPLDMIKINPNHVKKTRLLNLNYDYKDVMLRHTRNITEQNYKSVCNKNCNLAKNGIKIKFEDKFLNFSNGMGYLKDYIMEKDSNGDTKHVDNYLVREPLDNSHVDDGEIDEDDLQRNEYLLKKRVKISDLNSVYKLEEIKPHMQADTIYEDKVNCFGCDLI